MATLTTTMISLLGCVHVPSVNDTTTNRVQQPRHGNQDLRFRAAGEVVMSEQTL